MPEPFVWGRAGSRKTPEEVAREREMADAMIAKGLDFSPVGSWTQGAARVATALAGVIKERRGTQAESEGRQSAADTIAALLGGAQAGGGDVAPPAASEANYAPGAVQEPPGGDARDLMIRTIYGEAGGEPPEGQLGVASVINNRLKSGKFGGSLEDVILAPKQFSLWNKGDPAGDMARRLSPEDPRYQKIGQVVDAVLGGQAPDPTGGALNYYNPNAASPAWGPQLALANDVRIGNHRFVGNGGQSAPGMMQTAQAETGAPQMAPQQAQPSGGASVQQLMQAASNPWLSEGHKMVIGALLKQAMERSAPPEYSTTFAPNGDLLRTDNRGGTPQVLGNYAKPDAPEKPLVIGGKLVDPKTYQVLGDFTPPPAKPADIQEYEYAKGQGFQGSFTDYQLALKTAGANNTTVTVGGDNSADSKLRNKLSDKEGESWAAYKDAGAVSGGMLQDMEALDALTTMAPQGPIEGRLAQAFPGMSSAGAAFQSIVKRVAPTLRAPGSGSTSDIEYDGMLASLPSLQNRPDANRAIAAMMKAKAQINVERAAIIDQYQNEHLTASEARSRIATLNKRSIMGPGLKSLLSTLGKPQDGAPGPTDEPAPDGVDPELWQNLTPQERKLWQ